MLCPRCKEREKAPGGWCCAPCERAYHRESNRKYPRKRRSAADYMKEYRKRDPVKIRAHKRVRHAIKTGRLTRPDACERCKRKCKPQAHHHDYAKSLDVEWLCRTCHGKEHRIESDSHT